jgi:parallel beta-helix repeat protein
LSNSYFLEYGILRGRERIQLLKKTVSGMMLSLVLISTLTLVLNIQPVKASGTIHIRADGSIDPPTAPISTVDNFTYTFTDNISDSISVERNGTIIDGAGRTMHGYGNRTAIYSLGTSGVTVKSVRIESFGNGILLDSCSRCNISENSVTTMSAYGIALYGSSYVAVSRNNVTGTGEDGIFLDASSNNSMYNNDLKGSVWAGVRLWVSTHNIFYQNNMVNSHDGMFFDTSSYNIVSQNNISANKYSAIYLQGYGRYLYENNSFSSNYFIGNEGVGMVFEGSSGNTVWHNNFESCPPQIDLCPDCGVQSRNTFDDGYPSGGNFWSDYNDTDLKTGPYQNVTESDGIGDTPHVIDANNIDHYPFVKPDGWECSVSLETNATITDKTNRGTAMHFTASGPTGQGGYVNATMPVGFNTTAIQVFIDNEPVQQPFPIITTNGTHCFVYFEFTLSTHEITIRFGPAHDVAVTDVTPSKTVVGQNCSLNADVVVANRGGNTETFNVTTYANANLIETQTVKNLLGGTSTVLTFTWNTTGFAKGNYTISAVADALPGETDTTNNNYTDVTHGIVTVAIAGDVNVDDKVNMKDISLVAKAFGTKLGDTRWNPNADVTGSTAGVPDGKVDMKDMSAVAKNFGRH